MTQAPVNDPWAAAAARHDDPMTNGDTPAGGGQGGNAQSGLAGNYAAPASTASQLFTGPAGNFYPALFNKMHEPGTTFSGTILSPPKDVQSTSFPRNPGDPRLPQYWCTDPATGKRAPGTMAVDPITRKANDPVMDLLVELQTDCRFDAATLEAIGRPADYVDEGKRAWQVSGSKFPKGHVAGQPTNGMRALLDALDAAIAAGIPITDDESMVGLKLTVRRVQRLQPNVSTSPWTYVAKLEK